MSSKIFTPYRALGLTSNRVPLDIRYNAKHKENYVVTCVGKSFHTYNVSKLGIVSISNQHDDVINIIATHGRLVFTACENVAYANHMGKEVKYTYHNHDTEITHMLPYGKHLITVDNGGRVTIFDIESEQVHSEMKFSQNTFDVSYVMHPSTYLNKILFASTQGTMQLWNIKNNELLYTFEGWHSSITALAQSPATDVVAIGLSDGTIHLHNLRYDETALTFRQDWGAVISLSFRSDNVQMMVSGCTLGHIAVWDLDNKCLHSQMDAAHYGPVNGMKFLPNEPLLLTSSSDNSLKEWIFDMPDGGARLLKQRCGHSLPPNTVKYYGEQGDNIISAGEDSTIRSFSTVHDSYNRSLGRASYHKRASQRSGLKKDQHKMPGITSFAVETSRASDWDNIVACHRDEPLATTWNLQRRSMGKYHLKHERFDTQRFKDAICTAVDISSCGNFCMLGYSSGHVDLYNLQSGIFRGTMSPPTTPITTTSAPAETPAHDGAVRSVAMLRVNHLLVSAGQDRRLVFWSVKRRQIASLTFDSQITKIKQHRNSDLLAVSTDDYNIYLVDCILKKVVRVFEGHNNAVTDMTFSNDGRWLVSSGMDCTIRTWDIPYSKMIDCFLVESAVTSLDLSPLHDLLVTTHVDELGLYLWSNVTMFQRNPYLPALEADYDPQQAAKVPTAKSIFDESSMDYDVKEDNKDLYEDPEQLCDLVTISNVAHSRWLNLLDLKTIKERNKPKEPPKVPKAAPFFLPTVPGLEVTFDLKDKDNKLDEDKTNSSSLDQLLPLSKFAQLLQQSKYEDAFALLTTMGPSSLDSELRLLSPHSGGTMNLLNEFCLMVLECLITKKQYELVNSYFSLFIQLNGDLLVGSVEISSNLDDINLILSQEWEALNGEMNVCLTLTNYFKSIAL